MKLMVQSAFKVGVASLAKKCLILIPFIFILHFSTEANAESAGLVSNAKNFDHENYIKSIQLAHENLSDGSSIKKLYEDMGFQFDPAPDFCPNLNAEFFEILVFEKKQCFSIGYENTDYHTYAILLESQNNLSSNNRKLIIYNHGHGGLPANSDKYANEFLNNRLSSGYDILVVSMPFTGIDRTMLNVSVKTWDGWAKYDPNWMPNNPHIVFEGIDTGESHYMRFFIDSAVASTLFLKRKYTYISYVGLSGGATVGLYVCNVLQDIIDNCFLTAGVMAYKFRLTQQSYGDAEQISASFYKKYKVIDLIREIKKQKLYLIYNDYDPCCFNSHSATLFAAELKSNDLPKNIYFLIRKSVEHSYDPIFIENAIDNNFQKSSQH